MEFWSIISNPIIFNVEEKRKFKINHKIRTPKKKTSVLLSNELLAD
jgi:hypothetical protein